MTQSSAPSPAADVVAVVHAGFGAREVLDPPVERPRRDRRLGGGASPSTAGCSPTSELGPVGALIFDPTTT